MPRVLDGGVMLHARYQIRELVAQGGMGAVYQADDRRLEGRECAIKEVLLQDDGGVGPDEAREQFYREASTLARLDHPNLPKVSDYFSEGNRDYLVMDFVPGPDLQAVVDSAEAEGSHIPEKQVLDWARQLCDALEYLHTQKPPVLHRDIKPANIRLTSTGLIKLVDFGLVKLMMPDETRTVTVVHGRGTAHYTPMEQYGGETGHTDERSDIYAVGATLYHLLTGQPPLPAKDRFLRPKSLPPPQELSPTISERTDRAVMWAMGMHPDHRPANVAALRDVLFGQAPLPITQELQMPSARRQGEPSWGRALLANSFLLALLLIVAIAAAYVTAMVKAGVTFP